MGLALAQDGGQTTEPRLPDPKTAIPEKLEESSPPAGSAPGAEQVPGTAPGPQGSQETLSDKLGRTGGVIVPPPTGAPDMRVPAPVPYPNTTPVIPPPGSPGNPSPVIPK